jgi:hypothetical protein
MSDHAANPAAQPNSSLKAPSVASASCGKRNGECSMPSFDGAYSTPRRAAVWASFRRRDAEDDFAASGSPPPRIPLLYSGSRFGPVRRPAAGSLFCFGFAALRVTVSIYDGPSANAELRPWEAGPLAWLRLV